MMNCLYEHTEWIAPGNTMEQNFDSHLRIKVMALSTSPYVCIGKPCICNVFHLRAT